METAFPFVGKKEYAPDAAEYVRAFLHEKLDGKIAFNPYGFLGFLELFEKAIKAANAPNDGMKKGFPVYIWLATLCPAWKKCSTIDFTGGHHMGKDVGYVTPAITILEMLMKPIDEKVENKTLGYQLKEVNRVYDLVEKNPPPAA